MNTLYLEEVIKNGTLFDGETICFAGEYGDQVCDASNEYTPVTGMLYEFYENEVERKLNYYCDYKNGYSNGTRVSFYKNGNIKEICNMRKGVAHGEVTNWCESGKIKSKANYKYGIKINYKEWDIEGKLVVEITEPTEVGKKLIQKYDNLAGGKQNGQK
ncbi:MAG: hypothetical protein FWF59_01495 [Turicibacter sp.]|nr:hypothetical protein [Turicibacter sp.]